MSLKDYFEKPTKTIGSSSLSDIGKEAESDRYLETYRDVRERFLPNVDYSDPINFAFYGSAKEYYKESLARTKNQYPYDGSRDEKNQWLYESTYLDLYLFDNRYPRFNGYINMSYGGWGDREASVPQDLNGYSIPETQEYISINGGPNAAWDHPSGSLTGSSLQKQFEYANKYDNVTRTGSDDGVVYKREGNLKFDLKSKGVTVEFWLKKPAFSTSLTKKEVIFDMHNGELTSSGDYGRFRIELSGTAGTSPFFITAMSGTRGFQHQQIGTSLTTASITDWTHVALAMKTSGTNLNYSFYINGALNETGSVACGLELEEVSNGAFQAHIGSLISAPSGAAGVYVGGGGKLSTEANGKGYGKFSGSLDEFRYWKIERDAQQIGRYYWDNIGAGTNTDTANVDLGVYYKFNEGITGTSSTDSTVLDYSGRISNGTWTGYSSGARSTGSAMVLAGAAASEFKDPVLYSSHPDYVSLLAELEASGSLYDYNNTNSLMNSMPGWILEEDEEKSGELLRVTQILASYLDTLYLQIQAVNEIKDVYAHFKVKEYLDEAGELTGSVMNSLTGTVKPIPFAEKLLQNVGFVAPEIFANTEVIEKFLNRDETKKYDKFLEDVKNHVYQNVYANIAQIYKKKGNIRAFRNILHCFGIDEDIVKINFYADNTDFQLKDKHKLLTDKFKYLDFNDPYRWEANVYQYQTGSGTNIAGYISGSAGTYEHYIPMTLEADVVFPDKIPYNTNYGFRTNFATGSVLGIVDVTNADGTTTTTGSGDNCNLHLFVIRDEENSKHAKFRLSSSALNIDQSTDMYIDLYTNQKWNFAIRLKHKNYPYTDFVSGSTKVNGTETAPNAYTLEFHGVNVFQNYVANEFTYTLDVDHAKAKAFLVNSKRIYAGAKKVNLTGTLENSSDIKLGYIRYWMNWLDNDVMKQHAYDPADYGIDRPYENSDLLHASDQERTTNIETLILDWDFNTLSSSDASGQLEIIDASSGSQVLSGSRYDSTFRTYKEKFYSGRASGFPASDNKAVDVIYHPIARDFFPDSVDSQDMIDIRDRDDIVFTKETRPIDYFIAFEKSPAATISEEMIKFMSSIADFNELIGRPVEQYRQEYKGLTKLRQLFFEKVQNPEIDFDKYWDYYKWFDDALGAMLVDLVPASIKHSDGVNNVIENHVFDRDKYQVKYPTLELVPVEPEACAKGINELTYNWKCGHAPTVNPLVTSSYDDINCEWWYLRAEPHLSPLSQSVSGNNNTRKMIYQAKTSSFDRSFCVGVKMKQDINKVIHGGLNHPRNKRRDYVWAATKHHGDRPIDHGGFGGFPLRYLMVKESMLLPLDPCYKECGPEVTKRKRDFGAIDGFSGFMYYQNTTESNSDYNEMKGDLCMPFNLMSSSVTKGYTAQIIAKTTRPAGTWDSDGDGTNDSPWDKATNNVFAQNVNIVNLHQDSYGEDNEVPIQGPFTSRWVGGHQSRHANINVYDTNRLTAAAATATMEVTANLVDGEYFTIYDADRNAVRFTIDTASTTADGNWNADKESINVGVSSCSNNEAYAARIASAINGVNDFDQAVSYNNGIETLTLPQQTLNVTAVADGATVTLTQDTNGYSGNTEITSIFITGITITNFTGGAGDDIAIMAKNIDCEDDRAEGFRIVFEGFSGAYATAGEGSGVLAVVGPDYIMPSQSHSTYPNIYKPRGRYFRDEMAKRPVNIKNIFQTTSSLRQRISGVLASNFGRIGNYSQNYQVVNTFGRHQNNFVFKDTDLEAPNLSLYLNPALINALPKTTQQATKVAQVANSSAKGNIVMNFHPGATNPTASNIYRSELRTTASWQPQVNKTVIANRFSAPGGHDVQSVAFLDAYAKEFSVYNALPWRNLDVLGFPRVSSAKNQIASANFVFSKELIPDLSTIIMTDVNGTSKTFKFKHAVTTVDGTTDGDGSVIVGISGATTSDESGAKLRGQRFAQAVNAASSFNIAARPVDGSSLMITLNQGSAGSSGNTIITFSAGITSGMLRIDNIIGPEINTFINGHEVVDGGSGEEGTIRVNDIHNERVGLRSHLTRHSEKFGIDVTSPIDASYTNQSGQEYSKDVYDLVALGTPLRASYHKIQRNAKYDIAENRFDYDNFWVQHEIPRTDYQYAWVSASHDSSLFTSSLNRHLLHWITAPSGSSTYHPRDDIWDNYAVPSQSLHERRAAKTAAFQASLYINGTAAESTTYIGQSSYGFPSWEEVRLTDLPGNVIIKKTYGYNYIVNEGVTSTITPSDSYTIGTVKNIIKTVDESRVIFNIANDTTLGISKPVVNTTTAIPVAQENLQSIVSILGGNTALNFGAENCEYNPETGETECSEDERETNWYSAEAMRRAPSRFNPEMFDSWPNIRQSLDQDLDIEGYRFTYPYINIKYHFNNRDLYKDNIGGMASRRRNVSLYHYLLQYYKSSYDANNLIKPFMMHVNQILHPKFTKHTKYFVRARRYFISDFWADAVNSLTSSTAGGDLSITKLDSHMRPVGSTFYNGLDQIGRRTTELTASLFKTNLNWTALNIIYASADDTPTYQLTGTTGRNSLGQSIWPMDARMNFTSSDCSSSAGNGAYATATITISDAGGVQQSNTFILVDSAGLSTTYTINGGVASGAGGGSGGSATVGWDGVGGGTAGKVAGAAAIAAAINATTDANYTAVSDGVDTVTITQGTYGAVGNKTNEDNIGSTTVTNFTGGEHEPSFDEGKPGVLQNADNYFHNSSSISAENLNGKYPKGTRYIRPTPRYAYPHTLQSPGSMRCPSGRSSLGLISGSSHTDPYPLRSNHYWLTRSLGATTDGLYDSTAYWDVPTTSGLEPFQRSYEEWYHGVLKWHSKDYTLVPEFRISNFVKDYYTEDFSRFGSPSSPLEFFKKYVLGTIEEDIPQRNWLDLTGSSFDDGVTSASYGNSDDTDLQMLDNFLLTAKIKDIKGITLDNENLLKPARISLRCDALYKFLPYYGFFPQLRTVQMCEQFAESCIDFDGDGVEWAHGGNTDYPLSDNLQARIRPVTDIVMSPGLLYNTVKSGIAVDYPVITTKMSVVSHLDPYGGTNYMVNNEFFDHRVQWEALVDPDTYLRTPGRRGYVDTNPHPSASLNSRLFWNKSKDKVYTLMANNFFAEAINFFLDDCTTTKFKSLPDTHPAFGNVPDIEDWMEKDPDPEDLQGTIDMGFNPGAFKVGPIYRMKVKIYKSKKSHVWTTYNNDFEQSLTVGTFEWRNYKYLPTSETNYFFNEYLPAEVANSTNTNTYADCLGFLARRPQYNPYREVETITMYSQPMAFGPPCAGGVSIQHAANTRVGTADSNTYGKYNNTTYRMYDATNGFNAPYTPPYYDGEAWALVTFQPTKGGKHYLRDILPNLQYKFIRYELNHESGSFGDVGTSGPQGFTMNENAMQIDASINLSSSIKHKKILYSTTAEGNTEPVGVEEGIDEVKGDYPETWIIESKYETPILDFSKYLLRAFNFSYDTETNNQMTALDRTKNTLPHTDLTLSGAFEVTDRLQNLYYTDPSSGARTYWSDLAGINKISGALTPIGMWHQLGDLIEDVESTHQKGIFLELEDLWEEAIGVRSTEMTIANPKWVLTDAEHVNTINFINPNAGSPHNDTMPDVFNNPIGSIAPHFPRQKVFRRLKDYSSDTNPLPTEGNRLQLLVEAPNPWEAHHSWHNTIIDTELLPEDLTNIGTSGTPIHVVSEKKSILWEWYDYYKRFQNTNAANGADVQTIRQDRYFGASYYRHDLHEASQTPEVLIPFIDDANPSWTFEIGQNPDGPDNSIYGFMAQFGIGVNYYGQSKTSINHYVGADGSGVEIINSENGNDTYEPNILTRVQIEKHVSTTDPFEMLSRIQNRRNLIPKLPTTSTEATATQVSSSYTYQPQWFRGSLMYSGYAKGELTGAFEMPTGGIPHATLHPSNSLADVDNDGQADDYVSFGPWTKNPITIRWGRFMVTPDEGNPYKKYLSLADLVGFKKHTPKRMGRVKDSGKISEAIIAIPLITKANATSPKFLELNKAAVNKYLISKHIVTPSPDRGPIPSSTPDIGTSVKEQIEKMQRYVLPPHLDFITYASAYYNPMYIFEFHMGLEKQDYADLWQGVIPNGLKDWTKKVGKTSENIPDHSPRFIVHELDNFNLLQDLNYANLQTLVDELADLQWFVFKVKQKAETDYFKKLDNDRHKFVYEGLDIDDSTSASTYSRNTRAAFPPEERIMNYNWPYDFCSIVENVKLSVSVEYGPAWEADEPESILPRITRDSIITGGLTNPNPSSGNGRSKEEEIPKRDLPEPDPDSGSDGPLEPRDRRTRNRGDLDTSIPGPEQSERRQRLSGGQRGRQVSRNVNTNRRVVVDSPVTTPTATTRSGPRTTTAAVTTRTVSSPTPTPADTTATTSRTMRRRRNRRNRGGGGNRGGGNTGGGGRY